VETAARIHHYDAFVEGLPEVPFRTSKNQRRTAFDFRHSFSDIPEGNIDKFRSTSASTWQL
jgi:hypothetical protein